jgi:uncharacterized protein (DUF362 family)
MAENNDRQEVSRRGFLKAALAAGATIAGGAYFMDRNPVPRKIGPAAIRPFGVPNTAGRFAVARGENPAVLVRRAVDAVGGMNHFVQKGDRVLLKVNCAFARPAWMGATTSPEVTAEVVRLCREAGASAVRVTDNPISDAKSCFLKSGLDQAVREAGGEIILPSPSDFRVVKVSDGVIGPWEVFYTPLAWCDKLIGLPTTKSHNLCGASLAMKNWYGFIGGSRSRFHQNIHRVIVELAKFITPSLIVLDGTRVLLHNGPTGGSTDDVRPGEAVVASTDPVAVDAFGCRLLGLDPAAVEYIGLAQARKLGSADYRTLPGYREVKA